jgi:spore germination protein GerM
MRDLARAARSLTATATALVLVMAGCSQPGEPIPAGSDGPAGEVEQVEVEVFFTNLELGEIGEVFPVIRETTDEPLPYAALTQLVGGPTAEEREQGYSSWFSSETSGLLSFLRVADGQAWADFDPRLPEVIPGASSSAGSTSLLAELDATLQQFPDVTSTRYSLGGDVAAFYEWLQLAPPDGTTAPDDPSPEPGDSVDGNGTAVVEVYFSNLELGADDEVFPVERTVDAPAVLLGALEALVAGPTAEEASQGYSSWFSSDTAQLVDRVRIDDGVAYVAFDARLPDVIPNASTSAGSTALLAALDATVLQFPTVDDVVYTLEGDAEAFYLWLQRDPPS